MALRFMESVPCGPARLCRSAYPSRGGIFSDMVHVGDITQLHGGKLPPVDIITFGSPCQGLSVSGLRRGLADERSGLFSEAVRIIYEMRETTHGEYPKFALWENVPYVLQRIRHVPGFLDGVRTGREIHQRFKTLFHAGQQHRRALRRLHHAGHPANFIKEGFDPWPMCQSRRT